MAAPTQTGDCRVRPSSTPWRVPALCGSEPGFDRSEFHATFNAEILRVLTAALRP
ncbi:hypothetical protein [Plastoroseomonas arctica]|uniref:Uncharacterized protein n=1 Tax=Plastoroseomonas arctica TaxID=1509237 RepID=A0AAF1JYG7_9PROT|nr:hypothetical protein [Plastoroseomonas arctica]MBR0654381.1 hypothetical protein [Plastoroseomonas arctica]